MSASFTLPIGVDRNWTITIQQPDPITGLPVTSTQFIAGDTVSAEVWSGQGQEILFAPTASWDTTPPTGIVDLSIGASQTASLTPGKYSLRVLVNTNDGRTLPVLQAVLELTYSPGSSIPPTTYNTYNDLLAYADWLDDLNDDDTDLSGFLVQRHKARAWLDGIILSRCQPNSGTPNTLGFGLNYFNSNGINYYLESLLNENRLVVTETVLEIVSRYSLYLICSSMISPTDDRSGYQVMASEQFTRACNAVTGYIAEIDVNGTGIPPFWTIPVNIMSTRVPTIDATRRGWMR